MGFFQSYDKQFVYLGFIAPCVCLYAIRLLEDDDVTGYLAMFTTSMGIHEIAICGGFYFSHPDIAGPFAGSVFGITNTMAQIPGFVNPLLVAYLTPNVSHLNIKVWNRDAMDLWLQCVPICNFVYIFIFYFREHKRNGYPCFT